MTATEYEQTPDEIADGINPKKRRLLEALTQHEAGAEDDNCDSATSDRSNPEEAANVYTTRDVTQYAGNSSKELDYWFRQCVAEGLVVNLGEADGRSEGRLWRVTDRGRAVVEIVGEERDGGPETVREVASEVESLAAKVDSNQMMVKRLQGEIDDICEFMVGDESDNGSVGGESDESVHARLDAIKARINEFDEMLVAVMDRVEALETEDDERTTPE